MMLSHGDLVAVADGENLRLFRNKGVEPHIDLIEFSHPHLAAHNAGSGSRHHNDALNPDSDRQAEDGFAAASAGQLNRMALDGTLERLFVIADPRTLGELRKHVHPVLQARIVGELVKDLTGHSVDDITAAVRNA